MIAFPIMGVAFDALRANRLRSSLTLIGVIFGVTSIMTIMSALEGMQQKIEEQFNSLGPSTFMVAKMMVAMSHEEFLDKVKRKPITMADAELIEDKCELCEKVSPRAMRGVNVKYGTQTLRNIGLMGGLSNFLDIVDFEVGEGRFHTREEDLHKSKVCLIGDLVREQLFEGRDAIGKSIKVNGQKYRIIGIAEKQGAMFGASQDDFVVIPLSSYIVQFGPPRRGINVVIKATSVAQLPDAMDEVRLLLRTKRNVPFNKSDDFDLMTADAILDILNQFTLMFRVTLVVISSISLVIGGIVVMNIMMVSVSERTREIGIRKALGAKKNHILLQFLFESSMLTISGGLIGTAAGFFIARALVAMMDMIIEPSALAISAGITISTSIGLIFGIYPAMRAAKLDPVKALSYE